MKTDLAVLMPVFNNPDGLRRSLKSLEQEQISFEVVIVDDGSDIPIAPETNMCIGHGVVVLRLDHNRGIATALNHGLRYILSKGFSFIARLDAGDNAIDGRFQKQQKVLDSNLRCAAVSCFVDFVDVEGKHLFRYTAPSSHEEIIKRMHINNCMVHSGTMIRADALEALGLYDETLSVTEDYDLFFRLGQKYQLSVLPQVLCRCEYNPNGLSVAKRNEQQGERLKVQFRYFDARAFTSYYGLVRTIFSIAVPHSLVLLFKRACLR